MCAHFTQFLYHLTMISTYQQYKKLWLPIQDLDLDLSCSNTFKYVQIRSNTFEHIRKIPYLHQINNIAL